jgi:hypothetical protein
MMDRASESLIGEMSVMDSSGHQQLKWNRDNPDEIATAQTVFKRLMERGYSAFGAKTKTEPRHSMKTFDPEVTEVVMVPRITGG